MRTISLHHKRVRPRMPEWHVLVASRYFRRSIRCLYSIARFTWIYGLDHWSRYTYLWWNLSSWRSGRSVSVKEDDLYAYVIPVMNKKTQGTSLSSKVKYFITYNAEIEVASVEARPL